MKATTSSGCTPYGLRRSGVRRSMTSYMQERRDEERDREREREREGEREIYIERERER